MLISILFKILDLSSRFWTSIGPASSISWTKCVSWLSGRTTATNAITSVGVQAHWTKSDGSPSFKRICYQQMVVMVCVPVTKRIIKIGFALTPNLEGEIILHLNQIMLSYLIRVRSIIVQLTSRATGFTWFTKQVNLLFIQHKQSSWIQRRNWS